MRLSASRCARAATSFGLLLAIASGSARAQPGETGGAAAPPPPALTLGVNSSSSLAQAWTGFWGGTACTRVLDGHFVTLPGCRGVARLAELAAAGTPTSPFELVYHGIGAPGNAVIVTFQDDYDPRVDGCIFSPRMRVTSRDPNGEFFEIRGRHVDGSAVDLAHCERSLADPRLRDPVGDTNPGMWTPFHPLTGCWSDPTKLAVVEGSAVYRGNDGLPCPAVRSIGLDPNGADAISNFRIQVDHDDDPNTPLVAVFVDLDRNGIEGQTIDKRNFQNEFFNGLLPEGQRDPNARTPTVFQSEAAAVSWNILMLLVASSCNQELDDRDQDLDCFDYRVVDGVDRAYLSTRCSFAAPQYCRNLRALTLPESAVGFEARLRAIWIRSEVLASLARGALPTGPGFCSVASPEDCPEATFGRPFLLFDADLFPFYCSGRPLRCDSLRRRAPDIDFDREPDVRFRVCDVTAADADNDGISDPCDNCSLVPNASQWDMDLDGYGDRCDADYDNSGSVDVADLRRLQRFLKRWKLRLASFEPIFDHDGSGQLSVGDFGVLRSGIGLAPGPSGLDCAGSGVGCLAVFSRLGGPRWWEPLLGAAP